MRCKKKIKLLDNYKNLLKFKNQKFKKLMNNYLIKTQKLKDKTKIDCLNVLPDFPIQNALFDKGDSTYAKSDCDP